MRVKPFYSGLLLQALTYKFNEVVGTSAPGLIDEERLGTASGMTETKPIIKQLRTCLPWESDVVCCLFRERSLNEWKS